MLNRFWFSNAQWNPYHRCWVWNGAEWVEYTEWTEEDQKSNFEDARLVYETNDSDPQIKTEGDIETPY